MNRPLIGNKAVHLGGMLSKTSDFLRIYCDSLFKSHATVFATDAFSVDHVVSHSESTVGWLVDGVQKLAAPFHFHQTFWWKVR